VTTGRNSRVVASGIEAEIKLVVVERVEVWSRYMHLSGCMRSISARATPPLATLSRHVYPHSPRANLRIPATRAVWEVTSTQATVPSQSVRVVEPNF
jgi:hypothetical protein